MGTALTNHALIRCYDRLGLKEKDLKTLVRRIKRGDYQGYRKRKGGVWAYLIYRGERPLWVLVHLKSQKVVTIYDAEKV
jgi:hypothetical protein